MIKIGTIQSPKSKVNRNVIRHDEKPRDEEMFIDKGNEECKINKKTGVPRSSLKKVITYILSNVSHTSIFWLLADS